MGINMENSKTIAQIIFALRELFKDKDRLIGVNDWDTFIGILMLLEQLGESLREQEENNKTEG